MNSNVNLIFILILMLKKTRHQTTSKRDMRQQKHVFFCYSDQNLLRGAPRTSGPKDLEKNSIHRELWGPSRCRG